MIRTSQNEAKNHIDSGRKTAWKKGPKNDPNKPKWSLDTKTRNLFRAGYYSIRKNRLVRGRISFFYFPIKFPVSWISASIVSNCASNSWNSALGLTCPSVMPRTGWLPNYSSKFVCDGVGGRGSWKEEPGYPFSRGVFRYAHRVNRRETVTRAQLALAPRSAIH